MKKYAQLKDVEDITGLELKDTLMELFEGMDGASIGFMPVCKTILNDGRKAQVFVKITTVEDEIMD